VIVTMEKEDILEVLTEVFQEVFDDDSLILNRETIADDIEEWDSLNQIKLIVESERAFNVRLKSRDINILENIGEMVDHLSKVIG